MASAPPGAGAAGPPLVIGVAGGSGSGKTTVVRAVAEALGVDHVTVIHHDSYYRDCGHLPPAERQHINFDHPDALETELLVQHIHDLRQGTPVDVPVYDFAAHRRLPDRERVVPGKVIIVDGILILWDARLRELLDIRVFVDTDADVRLIRRLDRDTRERGRSIDSVIQQYTHTVRPMHLEFVEPSRCYADVIVPEGGRNREAVDMLVARVRSILL